MIMKKRKTSIPHHGDPKDDDEDSEMEIVDAEEKEAVEEDGGDSDDDDEEEEPMEGRNSRTAEENAFMDAFYGLSSSNPTERAQAANVLLHHCLIGPDANTKDAAYALRRLMNGLCSGRAASRQGNASALSAFLKLAMEGGQLQEIKNQDEKMEQNLSILNYVRQRLLTATDPSATEGKIRRSEERDYQFGRLFGVLSIARSGILLPTTTTTTTDNQKTYDVDQILDVSTGLVSDLVELYMHKKWMREPAAHAIGTILNSFHTVAEEVNDARKVVRHLVQEVVIPKLLLDETGSYDIETYTAEQIAIAANIQSHIDHHQSDGLPAPLNKPMLSTETLPLIANTLAETSTVTQPRTHLVWDSMWVFLTEPDKESSSSQTKKAGPQPSLRKLRDKPPIGDDSTLDIVESMIRNVIVDALLKVDSTGGKITHERRALALCLVRNLLGVPFNSSITGITVIQIDSQQVETILSPILIRRLFLDVICAGGGVQKKAHTLKPLALQILESMVDSMRQDASDTGLNRRVAMAQHLIRCEPRFDAMTKTTTVADLVGLTEETAANFGSSHLNAMQKYFDFLEGQIISSASQTDVKAGDVLSYIDLLYQSAKRLLRIDVGADAAEPNVFGEFRSKTVKSILGCFMASSFFDCENITVPQTPGSGKKSKKGKSNAKDSSTTHHVVSTAVRLNRLRKGNGNEKALSFDARSVLSERFFSLLADYVNACLHSGGGSQAKDSIMLDIVEDMCNGWKNLESAGAKPLFNAIDNGENDDSDESESPEKIVFRLQGLARDLAREAQDSEDPKIKARRRCSTSCAALASTLFLHLLGCGRPEDIMEEDDVTTEDDDDSADIIEAIEEIGELTPMLLDASAESEQNPLAGFADVCMTVLSSRLSSGTPGRGASPRLLREAIKFAWMGVLSASAISDRCYLDNEAISVLMDGIGAGQTAMDDTEGEDGDDDEEDNSDDDMDDDESSDGDIADFSKVGKILDADDDKDESDSEDRSTEPQEGDNQEQDVQINPEKLNSLLEDDSDAEIDAGELEHHAGADAALAALIKMKQEARKASRQARERLELEKQLRCTLLLETLLGKSESWGSLMRSDVVLSMAPSLLAYRNQIEKSLSKSSGKVGGADTSTKMAMLDRLTSILKSKLFKLKFSSMSTSESVDFVESCTNFAQAFMDMARKRSTKDQQACCSLGIVTVVKSVHEAEMALKVASIYESAVEEWSSKRTSRLEVSIFDDLIHHCPSVAQGTLLLPLASAATSARSPFLRGESFRLLSILLNPKPSQQPSELEALVTMKTQESLSKVASSICSALKDADMQKAKRVREVLKATEKLLAYAKSSPSSLSNLNELQEAIAVLDAKHENPGVKKILEKLKPMFDEVKGRKSDTKKSDKDEEMEDQDMGDDSINVRSKNDKKKKKKKKKKGKK